MGKENPNKMIMDFGLLGNLSNEDGGELKD